MRLQCGRKCFNFFCYPQVQKARQILLLRERLTELHRTNDLNLLDHRVQKRQRSCIRHKRDAGDGMEKGAEGCDGKGKMDGCEMEMISRCIQVINRSRHFSRSFASKVFT
jgi:hypothetical protein